MLNTHTWHLRVHCKYHQPWCISAAHKHTHTLCMQTALCIKGLLCCSQNICTRFNVMMAMGPVCVCARIKSAYLIYRAQPQRGGSGQACRIFRVHARARQHRARTMLVHARIEARSADVQAYRRGSGARSRLIIGVSYGCTLCLCMRL